MDESYSLTFEGGLTKSHDKKSTRGEEDRMEESLHIESCTRSRLASPRLQTLIIFLGQMPVVRLCFSDM